MNSNSQIQNNVSAAFEFFGKKIEDKNTNQNNEKKDKK